MIFLLNNRRRRKKYDQTYTKYHNVHKRKSVGSGANFELGLDTVLKNSKQQLIKYLKQKDYHSALTILSAIVQTGIYHPTSYWKIGEEIIRHLNPQDLSNYLKVTITGIRKPYNEANIKEYILHLLANDDPDKYLTVQAYFSELHLSLKEQNKSATMAKFFALITYDDWNQNYRLQKDKEILEPLKLALKEAYKMNTNDRYVIKCYLDVLNQSSDESDKMIIKEIIEASLSNCFGSVFDPELIGILLHFGKDYVEQSSLWRIRLCSVDPLADPRIAFLPLFNILESLTHHDHTFETLTRQLLNIILDRLEYGCRDSLVIEKSFYFANNLKYLDPIFKKEIWNILKSRDVLITLEMVKLDLLDGGDKGGQKKLSHIEHIINIISEFMEKKEETQPQYLLEDEQNKPVKRRKRKHHRQPHMNHQDTKNENHSRNQRINTGNHCNMVGSNPWARFYSFGNNKKTEF
ncbi:unnamed protein product [Cunninghamella blakesleeana]